MKKIVEERGNFTLNGAFILLLVFALLALSLSIFGVVSKANRLHVVATDLMRYVEVRGRVDSAAHTELVRLTNAAGITATADWTASYMSGGERVQFGGEITLTLSCNTSFGLGGVINAPITLRSTVTGRSEIYWK